MALNDTAFNVALDAIAADVTHVELRDDLGAPIERQPVTWNAASAGSLSASNQPAFTVPASTTVASVELFDAPTLGNSYGTDDVTPEVFANSGTYTLTSLTISLS